jgi:hypothetical protein
MKLNGNLRGSFQCAPAWQKLVFKSVARVIFFDLILVVNVFRAPRQNWHRCCSFGYGTSVRTGRPRHQASACIVSHQVLSEPYFVYLAERGEWQLGNDVNMLRRVNRSLQCFNMSDDRFL